MAIKSPGKSVVNWLLLGFVLLGLGGWGVSSFNGPATGAIGAVGDVDITADDYARGLESEMRYASEQTGRPVTGETARALGLPRIVQQRLITDAALAAEADDIGLSVGDDRVAEQIRAMREFGGPAGFDRARYDQALRGLRLSEARFERDIRKDAARLIQERAVAGATAAPTGAVAGTTRWLTETRDLSWSEVTPEQLTGPVAEPDDATLQAWHQANAARFTAPETRHISYAWLTPEMLAGSVQLDEAALRAAYEEHRAEYQQPERRMVDRLVYPDLAAATAAKARLDAGQASFDDLVTERGLNRAATDLGEVTQVQLGAAGAVVFAAGNNGVVGPAQTDLGPALFSVNAILDPIDISFEEAQADLRAEAAADKARRDIEALTGEVSDLLAGGATLQNLAAETPMQTGAIDWQAGATPEAGSIATYPEFRTGAAALKEGDFPEVQQLGDGGIFAATLDRVTPPTLIPFAEARPQVLEDWRAAETHKRLLSLADERRLAAVAGKGQAQGTRAPGLGRDGAIDGLPADVVQRGFALAASGDSAVVDADDRVFVVTLDAVHEADPRADQTVNVAGAVSKSLSQTLAEDYFDYYARALIAGHGLTLDQRALAAVDAQLK